MQKSIYSKVNGLGKKCSHLLIKMLAVFLFRLPWWLSKESSCNVRDVGLISGVGRYPAGGHGNPLQFYCLENPHGQRNMAGYSPWGHKGSDTTEQLSTFSSLSLQIFFFLHPSSLYTYSNVFWWQSCQFTVMVDTVQFFRLSDAMTIAWTFFKSTAPDILCKYLNSSNILAPAVFFSYLRF